MTAKTETVGAGVTLSRRYSADEKATILATITRAQQLCPDRSLTAILGDLGLPIATYYRWQQRALDDQLSDRVVVPAHPTVPATPQEIELVVQGARRHVLLGYKRLAYALTLAPRWRAAQVQVWLKTRLFCAPGWCMTFSIIISC